MLAAVRLHAARLWPLLLPALPEATGDSDSWAGTEMRCQCGEVDIADVSVCEPLGEFTYRMHWLDRCSEPMFVYDEVGEISPEAWARLADRDTPR